MKRNAAVVLGVAALVALGLASGIAGRTAKHALGRWNTQKRLAMREADRPFAHLAASQIGYGPSMRKQFTSARRFGKFQVTSERDGVVMFVGEAPVGSVP